MKIRPALFYTLTIICFIIGSTGCSLLQSAPVEVVIEPAAPLSTLTNAENPNQPVGRPAYQPGELVDYICQSGDTVPVLAVRFNTSVDEILNANPIIPKDATTMPPGLPLKIPIYYKALWGSSYQIIPDALFVNGPAQNNFNTQDFLNSTPGWFKSYAAWLGDRGRNGSEIIDYIALNFSISPRFLLAILEYQTNALTAPVNTLDDKYPLGINDHMHEGLVLQLIYAANSLNNAYYRHRTGTLTEIQHLDGRIEYPDPWQNAATIALHNYYASVMNIKDYERAISPDGFAKTYTQLFGDPWEEDFQHIPGSLRQPEMSLPFETGKSWAFTGGPHTGWGTGDPRAALDFAPPSVVGGCNPSTEWTTAIADGTIVRKETAIAVLDLDGDNNERTGWVVFYLHLQTDSIPPLGTLLKQGDHIGYPSCEGGRSTGTHVHIARKYNGEWIPAAGTLAFNLDGWIAANGKEPYQGTLTRYSHSIRACICSDIDSQIQSGGLKPTQSE